jgi:tellurite resistance protein TerC
MQTIGTPWLYALFGLILVVSLALDLGVLHRKAHSISLREAALSSAAWVALACAFGGFLWWRAGSEVGLQYFTGYVIEKALSIDNLFVLMVVMSFFAVPKEQQHRLLFFGIFGALVMRGLFVFVGAELLAHFSWVMYVFGALLVFTGFKMVKSHDDQDPAKSIVYRLLSRVVPSTPKYHGGRFTVVEAGKRMATPLLMALLMIEGSDVVFAVDSIPAVFAITRDPFIVFTSNLFAVLGLRALYFLIAGMLSKFRYLKYGLAGVLVFVGAKMLAAQHLHVPVGISLGVIGALLGAAIAVSAVRSAQMKKRVRSAP